MGTFSKIILSGSTDGLPINVTGTAVTLAVRIHTAITGGADAYDEVWLYGYNDATTAREVVLRWGASAAASAGATTLSGRKQAFTIPSRDGDYLLVPGHMMRAENTLAAFATVDGTATGAIGLHGWVNRFAS